MAKNDKKRASANPELDKVTIKCIDRSASGVLETIQKKKQPELKFPVRSLTNVEYDPKKGFFELGKTYTVIGYPARDGSAIAFVEQISLPDGRTVRIWFGDPNGSN